MVLSSFGVYSCPTENRYNNFVAPRKVVLHIFYIPLIVIKDYLAYINNMTFCSICFHFLRFWCVLPFPFHQDFITCKRFSLSVLPLPLIFNFLVQWSSLQNLFLFPFFCVCGQNIFFGLILWKNGVLSKNTWSYFMS